MKHTSNGRGMSRREALRLAVLGAGGLVTARYLLADGTVAAANNPAGRWLASTTPAGPTLEPFVASDGDPIDTGLPRRQAWANTAAAEFFLALTAGMEQASNERDIDFLTAISGDDPAKNVSQMEGFLAQGIGNLMMQPLDLASQRPIMERALADGVCVSGLITFPTTLQIAASQYNVGFTQGKAAADFAVANLDGTAEVHYFNLDSLSPQLQLRHQGVLDGLATGGDGIEVVSDITAADISVEGGNEVMNTVIQAHPDVKIVLGGDTLVVGAYQAIEQLGKLTDDMYFSGVDGDSQALDLVSQGGAYRASIAFAWQLMGYGVGQFGADWIEGKSIPKVIVAAPLLLDSPDKVEQYLADNSEPAAVFADRARYEAYLPLLGNIDFDSQGEFWTEEYVPE